MIGSDRECGSATPVRDPTKINKAAATSPFVTADRLVRFTVDMFESLHADTLRANAEYQAVSDGTAVLKDR